MVGDLQEQSCGEDAVCWYQGGGRLKAMGGKGKRKAVRTRLAEGGDVM
jgi:hypothetical protein